MIVGNGLLAKTFRKYATSEDIIIYASGVSDSNETREENFDREKQLLLDTIKANPNSLIVYFSSCDVIYSDIIKKSYYEHKLEMESIIQKSSKYHIFRLPQIIGKSYNKKSLINYFIDFIEQEEEIIVFEKAYKNIIAIQEVYKMIDYILEKRIMTNQTINIINDNYYSVLEVINILERLIGKKAFISFENIGFKPSYNKSEIEGLEIDFTNNYLENALYLNYFSSEEDKK